MTERRGNTTWREVGVVIVIGLAIVAAGHTAWRLMGELRRLRSEQLDLKKHEVLTQEQLNQFQAEQAQLTKNLQLVATDRDNLVAQVKHMAQAQQDADTQRQLFEDMFRGSEAERLALLHRLGPLETQQQELVKDREFLINERAALQQSVVALQDRVQKRTEEKRLKQQLADAEKKRKQLEASLAKNSRTLDQVAKERASIQQDFAKLKQRYEPLQERYAQLLSDNKTLKRKVERLPGDLADLTREHERLIKDLGDTHYNMGVMFSKRRDFPRAAAEFQKAIELKPDDADAYYNLGVIYAEHLPDRGRATTLLRQYLVLSPEGAQANWAQQYIASWRAWEAKERLE